MAATHQALRQIFAHFRLSGQHPAFPSCDLAERKFTCTGAHGTKRIAWLMRLYVGPIAA